MWVWVLFLDSNALVFWTILSIISSDRVSMQSGTLVWETPLWDGTPDRSKSATSSSRLSPTNWPLPSRACPSHCRSSTSILPTLTTTRTTPKPKNSWKNTKRNASKPRQGPKSLASPTRNQPPKPFSNGHKPADYEPTRNEDSSPESMSCHRKNEKSKRHAPNDSGLPNESERPTTTMMNKRIQQSSTTTTVTKWRKSRLRSSRLGTMKDSSVLIGQIPFRHYGRTIQPKKKKKKQREQQNLPNRTMSWNRNPLWRYRKRFTFAALIGQPLSKSEPMT